MVSWKKDFAVILVLFPSEEAFLPLISKPICTAQSKPPSKSANAEGKDKWVQNFPFGWG